MRTIHTITSIVLTCAMVVTPLGAQAQTAPATPSAQTAASAPEPKIPADQLDSLVAPIALYPDPLLSQTLVASTYPLEIVQLQQWMQKNPSLKDKALTDAVAKQPWDPSIQAMSALPDVVKRLAEDIQWTTDLGNAFLAQQGDVMDAVQRMRKKAQGTGALVTNENQKVETKVVETKTVIVVEQANPQVVYVPTYVPTVVYGPPIYPYPPIYYPPYPYGAVVATSMISFGVGVAMGAAWGGGWGYGCGWGGNDIDINVNNNFVKNNNINRNNVNGGNKWNHNAQHRGGAPYGNKATADRYGGTARGSGTSRSSAGASQQSAGSRSGSSAARSPSASSASAGSRSGAASGGGDRVGSREVPRSSGSSSSAFSGSSGGSSRAQASSSRGASSSSAARGSGGGGSRSGGGGGGGGRRR